MFEYYTCTTVRPTCTRGRRRRIVRKKKTILNFILKSK